ncbi:MAG: hypothetical protein ACEQSX_18045 [Baekduiaceae bacterium]
MSEIEDRRQRAREAYWDSGSGRISGDQVGDAIETATRVRITPEIVAAVHRPDLLTDEDALRAAFTAAGFEVEQ